MTVRMDTKEFDDYLKDLKNAPIRGFMARRRVNNIFHERGEEMVKHGQDHVPVRTGYLRSTINYRVYKGTEKINFVFSAHAFYAGYVEHGTSKMSGRKFMRNAWDEVYPDLVTDLANETTRWARRRF